MVIQLDKPSAVEEILNSWDLDSKMDSTEPGQELLKIPNLHAKYARMLAKNSLIVRKLDRDVAALKKLKWDYYSGKMDETELKEKGLQPFKFVLKGEVAAYVEGDAEMLNLNLKKGIYEEMVAVCSSIMKELNSRTYQLRAFIDWEKFIGGQ